MGVSVASGRRELAWQSTVFGCPVQSGLTSARGAWPRSPAERGGFGLSQQVHCLQVNLSQNLSVFLFCSQFLSLSFPVSLLPSFFQCRPPGLICIPDFLSPTLFQNLNFFITLPQSLCLSLKLCVCILYKISLSTSLSPSISPFLPQCPALSSLSLHFSLALSLSIYNSGPP